MVSLQEMKKEFVQFLSLTSLLPQEGHVYFGTQKINLKKLQDIISNIGHVKIITDPKKLYFPGWLGVVYCWRKGRQYDVYFISSSGEISLLLMTNNVEEIETELIPISGLQGVQSLPSVQELDQEMEDFTQTLPSMRCFVPLKEEVKKPMLTVWWEEYRVTIEKIFVGILTTAITILTYQVWFHWFVALGVFLSFLYLQINFENQKLNPQTMFWNYFFLYGKEVCWIVVFIATHSFSGLLSPFLTMFYAPYRNLAEKLFKSQ